jgi:hypothetical protein
VFLILYRHFSFEKLNQNFSTSVPKYNKNSELASKMLDGLAKFTDYQQEKFTDMGSGNRKKVPSLTKNDPKNVSSTTNDLNFSLSYPPRTQHISLIKIINQKQFPEQEWKCKHF